MWVVVVKKIEGDLTAEAVQGAALSLERVDNVERCDGLSLRVLGVCDGVTDDTLEEGLENTTGLLVDHWERLVSTWSVDCWLSERRRHTGRDTLDTSTARETADGGLCDSLDVVTKDLAVTLGTTLSESLSSLSACKTR